MTVMKLGIQDKVNTRRNAETGGGREWKIYKKWTKPELNKQTTEGEQTDWLSTQYNERLGYPVSSAQGLCSTNIH